MGTLVYIYNINKEAKANKYAVKYKIYDDEYSFYTNGYYAFVIDFSRGIINPESYDNLIDPSLPQIFHLVKNYEGFRKNEMESHQTFQVF